MNKIKIVGVIGLILFIVYLSLVITEMVFHYLGEYDLIVFTILLSLISINMINKGIILKSTTTLWFAINMIIYAIIIVVMEILKVDINSITYLWSIVPIIPSLLNLMIFNNYIYIKLIIINLFIFVPLVVINYIHLNIWFEWGIIVLGLIIGMVVCRLINLDKENV